MLEPFLTAGWWWGGGSDDSSIATIAFWTTKTTNMWWLDHRKGEVTSFIWNWSRLALFMSSASCTVPAAFRRKSRASESLVEKRNRISLTDGSRPSVIISFFSSWRTLVNTGNTRIKSGFITAGGDLIRFPGASTDSVAFNYWPNMNLAYLRLMFNVNKLVWATLTFFSSWL